MSKERFERKLRENLMFIQISSAAYDQGIEFEALRIAVCLRVLFYKPNSSRPNRAVPLVEHLGMEGIKMLSSNTGAVLPMGWVDINLNLGSRTPVKAVPKLKNKFQREPLSLHEWWAVEAVYQHSPGGENAKIYTRKDIILTAADQDGGAHVDKKIEEFYIALSEGKFNLGIDGANLKYHGNAPFDQSKTQYAQNFHHALIRQFAYEVISSAHHFKWLGGNLPTLIPLIESSSNHAPNDQDDRKNTNSDTEENQ